MHSLTIVKIYGQVSVNSFFERRISYIYKDKNIYSRFDLKP